MFPFLFKKGLKRFISHYFCPFHIEQNCKCFFLHKKTPPFGVNFNVTKLISTGVPYKCKRLNNRELQ